SYTKHHLKYRNHFGIFRTAFHTVFSKGDSLSVEQYLFSTKSARKSFTDFERCLVLMDFSAVLLYVELFAYCLII
ncbi:MAG: hypothetical protein UIM53_02465, partial [Acutalibacteraceae bacterium]|nr:hypothetical protein [Acutalibacteraceae bacterium]